MYSINVKCEMLHITIKKALLWIFLIIIFGGVKINLAISRNIKNNKLIFFIWLFAFQTKVAAEYEKDYNDLPILSFVLVGNCV